MLFISTGATLPSTSVSTVAVLVDKTSFVLGVGAVGTGVIAGARHQAEHSSRDILAIGVVLFLLSTVANALTIPSLTFFPILQLLFLGGIILTALLPYILIAKQSDGVSS